MSGFDAVSGCKAWIENKRRYGVADFSPTQVAVLKQVESIGAEAAQLLDRRNRMQAEIERADSQLGTAENTLTSLQDAFERESAVLESIGASI